MTEFKFTIDQIKDIFQSGVDRGHDEAADLKWGSFSSECRFSGCIGAVYDTINHGKKYDDADYVSYDVVEKWFATQA